MILKMEMQMKMEKWIANSHHMNEKKKRKNETTPKEPTK